MTYHFQRRQFMPASLCPKRLRLQNRIVLFAFLFSISLPLAAFCNHDDRPNVVVFLADDLGSKDIGCYGGPVKTPALDGLAASGIRFTNFYSTAPVCSTARASLLTGRHHLRTGVYTVIQDHMHDMYLIKREVTIAEHLKSNGYDTVHVGKWHLGTPFRGRKKPWIDEHGFDYWFATDLNAAPSHRDPINFWRNRKRVGPLKGYACQLVVDEAINWLDQNRNPENRNPENRKPENRKPEDQKSENLKQDKPFFLNVWFHEPHAPLAAPDNIVSQYGSLNDQAAIYSGTIDNTDQAIARLLKKLEQIGALENTIIFYTSDHGSYRKERNGELKNGKGSIYEGGIRTPGIFYWPKQILAGQVQETPAGSIDLLPTLCGLIGIDKPKGVHLDGSDLSLLLTGKDSAVKRDQPLTWHSPLSQPAVAIRDGKYSLVGRRSKEYPKDKVSIDKIVGQMRIILEKKNGRELTRAEVWDKCYNSSLKTEEWKRLRSQFVTMNTFQESWIPIIKNGSGGISRFELYDLSADPGQKKNLVNKFPEIASRLKEEVLAINADVLKEAPTWPAKNEKDLAVHRLESNKRSRFDAFVYINRIPVEHESDETPKDLSGRILGRLANQEGRVLVKVPPGMKRDAYNGFKIALETAEELHSGRCFECHRLPDLGDAKSKPPAPSLRNQTTSIKRLGNILKDKTHQEIRLNEQDVKDLHAFMQTLGDLNDSEFRDSIIKSTVLDTSGEKE